MSVCLYCSEEINSRLSWAGLLQTEDAPVLCTACREQLKQLSGKRCRSCSRESTDSVCSDCIRWEQHYQDDPLTKNISVYSYNLFMQEIIAKWKYRGDYIVGQSFASTFSQAFLAGFAEEKKELVAVPIPLSRMRGYDRAFNQAEALAQFLPLPMKPALERKGNEKQSKKSRKERLSTSNPFILSKSLNKSVVLVDDIYTTGRTLRHAAEILKKNGSPTIYAMTLIRG